LVSIGSKGLISENGIEVTAATVPVLWLRVAKTGLTVPTARGVCDKSSLVFHRFLTATRLRGAFCEFWGRNKA
jgi:hypothetical protein